MNIIKQGSRGQEVKDLQEFLGLSPVDGIFGPATLAAVIKWQASRGLTPDGIVGPKTWDAMGIASTDLSEKVFTTPNGLIVNKDYMPSDEYCHNQGGSDYVFLHHTAGWHNPYNTIRNWANDNRGRVATEFVLGGPSIKGNDDKYDGVMVQAFPEGNYGWHLGKNGSQYMHIHSTAIEVCNFGYVVNGKAYQGTTVDESQIVTLDKPFRGHSTWHRYSDAQIEALRLWILWIAERDNINVRRGLPKLIKEKGADAFEFNPKAYYGEVKGLWTHTNTRKDKVDMFPQQELMDMLVSL